MNVATFDPPIRNSAATQQLESPLAMGLQLVGSVVRCLQVLVCVSSIVLTVCATGPRPYGNRGKLRLIAAPDFAAILVAHCEAGIELARAVEAMEVGNQIKQLAATLQQGEENDRDAILAWIKKQTSKPSQVGEIGAAEVRAEHVAAVEQLRKTVPAEMANHALRVLLSHVREELQFMNETPVEDEELRTIVNGIWRRLSDQAEDLSRRLPQPARPK